MSTGPTLAKEPLLRTAIRHFRAQQYAEAEALCLRISTPVDDAAAAANLLGMIASARQVLPAAEQHFMHAIRLKPHEAGFFLNLGFVQSSMDKPAEAEKNLRHAVQLSPGKDALTILARVLRQNESLEECAAYLRLALELDPVDANNRVLLLNVLSNDLEPERYPLAVAAGGRLLAFPQNVELWNILQSVKAGASWQARSAEIEALPLDWTDAICLARFATAIARKQGMRHHGAVPLISTATFSRLMSAEGARDYERIEMLKALAFRLDSPPEWNRMLFESYVLPAMEQAFARGDHGLGLLLDNEIVFSYYQQPCSISQAKSCLAVTLPLCERAGAMLKAAPEWRREPAGELPTIAFICDFLLNRSSPYSVLANVIEGIHALESPPFNCIVVALDGVSREMRDQFERLNTPVADFNAIRGCMLAADDKVERYRQVGTLVRINNVAATVFTNARPGFTVWMAAQQRAETHICWSMGFHIGLGASIDAYVSLGSPAMSIQLEDGVSWRLGPVPMKDPYPPGNAARLEEVDEKVRAIRASLLPTPGVIISSLGRWEKIDNDTFLDTLARILWANPQVIFLWYDKDERKRESVMAQKFAQRGIAGQCVNVGWVDMSIYAKVVDIHLDAFPLPSGLTMFDTMGAGRAWVWLDTTESRQLGGVSNTLPLLDGSAGTPEEQARAIDCFADEQTGASLLPLACTVDDYVNIVQRMIDDPGYRGAVGRAGRKFMERFKYDLRVPARIFAGHFLDAIREKRGQ